MLSDQHLARRRHSYHIQRIVEPGHAAGRQRAACALIVDQIAIAPPPGAEPRMKTIGNGACPSHGDR